MRKLLTLIMVSVVTMTTLTGCGEKKNTDTSQAQSDAKGVENANTSTDSTIPNSAFKIALNGDNEANFTLNHKAVGKLESIQNGDSRQLVNEINVYLESDSEESYIPIYIGDCDFNIYEENPSADVPEWQYSEADGGIRTERNGNTISAKVNHIGIANILGKYTDYRVEFSFLESGENEVLEEGKVADIIRSSDVQTTDNLQIVFYNNNTVKFKVYGDDVKSAFYNYKNINIRLYENNEQQNEGNKLPTIEFQHTQLNTDTGRGIVTALTYSNEDNMIKGHDLAGGERNPNSASAASDYGIAMKYVCEGISNEVKNANTYEVYVGDELMCMGYVDDAVIEKEYDSILSIPADFRSGDADDNYFVPVTDNYKIIEVTYCDNQFGTVGWYQRMGKWVYGATEPYFNEIVKVVYLLSFDEIGIVDGKMKILYESENGLIADIFMNFPSYIIAEDLTGVNEPDESLITTEFLDLCDKEVFDFTTNESTGYVFEYFGQSNNSRYYNFTSSWSSELPHVVGRGFGEYTDVQYSSNEIHEETWNEHPIRTYSTEEKFNYIDNVAQYNTAPEDWHDHPYASFIPELPQGVMVNYTPTNDEDLRLGTEVNGCTREQALELIEKMRKIEYTQVIADIENDEEIVYKIGVDGGIDIGVGWYNESQQLIVFALKN